MVVTTSSATSLVSAATGVGATTRAGTKAETSQTVEA